MGRRRSWPRMEFKSPFEIPPNEGQKKPSLSFNLSAEKGRHTTGRSPDG